MTSTASVPRAVHGDLVRLSYELFGHFKGAIEDFDAFFEHQMRRAGAYLVGGPPA